MNYVFAIAVAIIYFTTEPEPKHLTANFLALFGIFWISGAIQSAGERSRSQE